MNSHALNDSFVQEKYLPIDQNSNSTVWKEVTAIISKRSFCSDSD